MNKTKLPVKLITPVLLSFFVMSFCDLVGIGVDNAKADFELSNTLAQLIPMAVFAWFFILSVPVGIIQDRIGKKNMLNIGMFLTALGLILPFLLYTFPVLLTGFALLGIGNTIIQVSANPLLIDVVPSNRSSSFLSFSQFVKSIGSMVAPFLATFFTAQFGNWKIMLLVFGVLSIISALWLHFSKIEETHSAEKKATVASCLKLLGTGYIALMVLGIFVLVGIDVGINSASGQFLMEKLGMAAEPAKQGRSLYFFGKMLGTFLGALVLIRFSGRKFLLGSSVASLVILVAFILSPTPGIALTLMFATGLAASNIFPLIFSLTIEKYGTRANEISGLMIMAVAGGAFIPPVIGKITDLMNVTSGLFVLIVCAVYLLGLSVYVLRR
ncbi:MFS transporter [Maribellus sp. YY47]|uniref:MFS transporter n=1 Tax=Maribellus sp. YY47 TaxID=2929486 RepID=UPI00200123E5|nr:MFS transporter [Maribellus sp. YY47]MCK3683608.1 MFS transporter [Maribellus sp. YY47]